MKIEGTHNTANVMIDTIDATTEAQIRSFLECPAMSGGNIAIMPDCHAGAGAVIGFTMPVGEYVIPNIVGVYTTTATAETLDEAPGAYKPMDLILEAIKDTVEVKSMVKPVYNFKAGGE